MPLIHWAVAGVWRSLFDTIYLTENCPSTSLLLLLNFFHYYRWSEKICQIINQSYNDGLRIKRFQNVHFLNHRKETVRNGCFRWTKKRILCWIDCVPVLDFRCVLMRRVSERQAKGKIRKAWKKVRLKNKKYSIVKNGPLFSSFLNFNKILNNH